MIYLQLFYAYLQIGLFSIGGGHASIPVAQSVIVDSMNFLSMEEFTAMITISEMTPGPFAINSATYVGLKMGGVIGGIVATLGFLLPSLIICPILYFLLMKFRSHHASEGVLKGIRPAVSGLISSAGLSITLVALIGANTLLASQSFAIDIRAIIIFCISLFLSKKAKINSVLIIFISGLLGLLYYL